MLMITLLAFAQAETPEGLMSNADLSVFGIVQEVRPDPDGTMTTVVSIQVVDHYKSVGPLSDQVELFLPGRHDDEVTILNAHAIVHLPEVGSEVLLFGKSLPSGRIIPSERTFSLIASTEEGLKTLDGKSLAISNGEFVTVLPPPPPLNYGFFRVFPDPSEYPDPDVAVSPPVYDVPVEPTMQDIQSLMGSLP
jgi:hypothetical protein